MDPSILLSLSYDSLKEVQPEIVDINTGWYSQNGQIALRENYTYRSTQSGMKPTYCNVATYDILQRVKDAFDTDGFVEARDATNPFEQIGRSIFINRAGVKLANIDAVHHVSKNTFTFDKKTSDDPFTFCDIAAGPGGFTQYMQYRYPNSIGYGMTLRSTNLDWSTKFINMDKFTPFYGPDNSGNLYSNHESFVEYVLKHERDGVDLVTGDGGFDLEDNNDKTLLHQQEFLSSRLLLTQCLVGIGCTKIAGNFVVKVFDTVTTISAQILFVLAQCFQKILIFKPATSRPANAERYVICMNRNPDVGAYYQLLLTAAKSYTNEYLATIFANSMDVSFEEWLTISNNESINRQLEAAERILRYLKGLDLEIPSYNIHKFLTIWNLPDTPLNNRRDLITIS